MGKTKTHKKVAVTGICGGIGPYLLNELTGAGHHVIGIDMNKLDIGIKVRKADLRKMGEALWALENAEVVVHFGAIAELEQQANHVTFSNNASATCNVFEASRILGIKRVILASSVSAYGFCWASQKFPPRFLPLDETHPLLGQDCYALSKAVCEEIAAAYNRLLGMDAICLRFPWAVLPQFYEKWFLDAMHGCPDDAAWRHLWAYCDVRDLAQAVRLAVEHPQPLGFKTFNVIADDHVLSPEPILNLIKSYFPQVPVKEESLQGDATAIDNSKIKKILGFKPRHTWRMHADLEKWRKSRANS